MATTYHIASCDGNDLSIASRDGNATMKWLRQQHLLSASPSYITTCGIKSDDFNASRDCDDFNATYHIASHDGDDDNASMASHVISPHAMAVTMMTMRYKDSNTTAAVDEEVTCYTSSIDATINY